MWSSEKLVVRQQPRGETCYLIGDDFISVAE